MRNPEQVMSDLERIFREQYPDAFVLNADEPDSLERHLKAVEWISADEKIMGIGHPGEGNMNLVLRVRTNQQTLILKQARPWVEKYPQIAAPVKRVEAEAKYYLLHRHHPNLKKHTPTPLGYDAENFLLALEDLGENADFLRHYQRGSVIKQDELTVLINYLSLLHNTDFGAEGRSFPDNTELRTLNHEHIFKYPYAIDNGFDLDTIQEGLQNASMAFKSDHALIARVDELGSVYLGSGPCLLHGDYYPGSWLSTEDGIRIIDPEFAHFGRPEFDVGVMLGHLKMTQMPNDTLKAMTDGYQRPNGFDDDLAVAFCGVEILRRIIGLAQLPLELTLEERRDLLEQGRNMILKPIECGLPR